MTFRIAFLNPPGHPTEVLTVSPPFGILSMAAVAREAGIATTFIDADVLRLDPDEVVKRLAPAPPDLLGISLNVSQVAHAAPYLRAFQAAFPQTPIVAGGPYVTGTGQDVFLDFPQLSFAILYEGEKALIDLSEHLQGKRPRDKVRNLLLPGGNGRPTGGIERIEDLNDLPLPDYQLVASHFASYTGAFPSLLSPSTALLCARGCPFECTFCSSPKTWGRRVTFRSPEKIVKEVKLLHERFNVGEVFFQDDTMNLRHDWFRDLCNRLRREGLHEKMAFKAPFKADPKILTPEILNEAAKTNFWMIFFGVENGDPAMLERMKKRLRVEDLEDAFRATHEAGLCTFASFMIGNPGETRETVEASLALAEKLRPDFGGFAVAAPYPGSELHRIAKENGHMRTTDFRKYHFGNCILRTEALSFRKIAALATQANARLTKITSRPPIGKGKEQRGQFRKRIQERYGPPGRRLSDIIRSHGLRGLFRKALGSLGRRLWG